MDDSNFAYNIRTQYRFVASDSTLAEILSGIAGRGINLTGYFQTKPPEPDGKHGRDAAPDCNLVRMVVGSPDAETISDLRGAMDVLASLCVEYQDKPVIQVLQITPGVPGVINAIFGALWRSLAVYATYIGEDTHLFIDVSDIEKALEILTRISG
jgi:hypothetical protein